MSTATTYQSYYTKSEPIINYMTGMLNIKSQDSVWEPCGGDGAFVDKILEQSPHSNICIYELNPIAVSNLRKKYHGINNISIKIFYTYNYSPNTGNELKLDSVTIPTVQMKKLKNQEVR